MELLAKLLFKILGLGAVVTCIEGLEFADRFYSGTRWLPQPFADFFAIVTIGIILLSVWNLEKHSS